MKRIALIADIHGNFLALQKVVEDIKRRQTDTVFNLGDHISGPLWLKETIEFIMNQKNWINISGNHDRQLITQNPETHGPSDRYAYQFLTDSEKEWLKNLPAKMVINNEFFYFMEYRRMMNYICLKQLRTEE